MEKKTDNAIVREDAVENTDFGAEIKNRIISDEAIAEMDCSYNSASTEKPLDEQSLTATPKVAIDIFVIGDSIDESTKAEGDVPSIDESNGDICLSRGNVIETDSECDAEINTGNSDADAHVDNEQDDVITKESNDEAEHKASIVDDDNAIEHNFEITNNKYDVIEFEADDGNDHEDVEHKVTIIDDKTPYDDHIVTVIDEVTDASPDSETVSTTEALEGIPDLAEDAKAEADNAEKADESRGDTVELRAINDIEQILPAIHTQEAEKTASIAEREAYKADSYAGKTEDANNVIEDPEVKIIDDISENADGADIVRDSKEDNAGDAEATINDTDVGEADATIETNDEGEADATISNADEGTADATINDTEKNKEENVEISTADIEYDEDGFILEDEFSNIPESFFDEDIFDSDDASSISALLYDDDDDNAEAGIELNGSVSFSDLKLEMQRIKDEAKVLHATAEETEAIIEDSEHIDEDNAEGIEENDATNDEPDEGDVVPEEVDESKDDEPTDEPEAIPEKKRYFREIEKEEEEPTEADEEITEHIITIDHSRIREKSVPEGRFIDTVFEAVELFTFTILVVMMLLSFAFRHSAVSGDSMMPTFNDGDRLIVSSLFYSPKRGDVVVFDDRTNEGYDDEPIIKRIIALEGDTVKIEGGIVYVKLSGSDDFIVADYVNETNTPLRDMYEIVVPEGEMFVMGDNVNVSKDSRDPMVGTVKVESIIGKVILRFYATEEVESDETGESTKNGRIVFHTNFKTKKQGE